MLIVWPKDLPCCYGICITVKDQKAEERASKSSSISSRPRPKVQLDYDPTSEQDTNFAALMTLMGASGWQPDKDNLLKVELAGCPTFRTEMRNKQDKQTNVTILWVSECALGCMQV